MLTQIKNLTTAFCLWGAAITMCLGVTAHAGEPQLAFPGAEGAGRFSSGGRKGEVYFVTTLNDDGPGSLRDAVSKGNRTILFSVSGTIDLKSDLVISVNDLTIAGQSAPGDGICVKGSTFLVKGAHNIIVRYLRVRPGDERETIVWGIRIYESSDVIIDHCSVSWWIDEGINTWHYTNNVTIQWCIMAEGLNRSFNRGPHAFGASLGGNGNSFHHNLYANNTARNPSVAGQDKERTINMDHRCSVIFNWEHRTCDGKPYTCNVVNNYYKPGPATQESVRRRIVSLDDASAYGFDSTWYIEGNYVEGAIDAINKDNWKGGIDFGSSKITEAKNRSRTPFPAAPVTTQSAQDAYELVLASVGASLPKRDAVDERIILEVRTGKTTFGNGIIDSQKQVGGWPELKSAPAPVDSDGDGIPDAWEIAHGLDPKNPADGKKVTPNGYTNLENYLNDLVK